MMLEKINQPVNVLASFTRGPTNSVRVIPHLISWNGKRYKCRTMGLYHPARRGDKKFHVFEFAADDTTKFRLELDPETLEWILVEAYYAVGN